jgi:hypothetical protein
MGLFGNNEPSQTEELLNQQNEEAKAELEQKKQSLYQTRLDLIKSNGGQSWTPNLAPPYQAGNSAQDVLEGIGRVAYRGISDIIKGGKG